MRVSFTRLLFSSFLVLLLLSCTRLVRIENPQEKFYYFLKRNHRGEFSFIKSRGDLILTNDYSFRGKFKFEADSTKTLLFLYSPFGTEKYEGDLNKTILLLTKIFYAPLNYIGKIRVVDAFYKEDKYIFKLEGGIEISFNEAIKISKLKFPDFTIHIDWKDENPYNISIVTNDFKAMIKVEKIEIKFENGKDTDF